MMPPDPENEESASPDVEMEQERTYQRQLRLFASSSSEKGLELIKIGEILGGLRRRHSFLDIGAGGGDLTIPLAGSFRKTTVVEPNSRQIAFLRRQRPEFECIHDNWERVDLGERRFDFILCSHVLYYIDREKWLPTVVKMHAHLEPAGRLVLVVQSPIGQVAEFFNAFTRYDAPVLPLWKELGERYGPDALDVRYFLNDIRTKTLEDMVDIGLFLLCDRRFGQRRQEIAAYFENRHRVPGGYRLVQDEILLSVTKGASPPEVRMPGADRPGPR